MSGYSAEEYPNLHALDLKVAKLLKSKEAKNWTIPQTEYFISSLHPVYFFENYLYIKAGTIVGGAGEVGIVPFKLTTTQLKISDKICAHLVPDTWERIQVIILKHRKAGISTLCSAFDYWFMRFVSNLTAFIIADVGSHTDNIMSMIELAQQKDECGIGCPDQKMLPPRRIPIPGSKKGIRLSNGSMAEQDSGENSNPGTSGTIQVCHMSENAKWRDPQTSETSLLNSIPRTGFVFIVKESTAFGLNKWAEDCEAAETGRSNWEFIFVTWKDLPDCEYPVKPNEIIKLSDEEKKLAATYKLSLGHIKFRRSQIELLGSEQQFKQDFPLNSREPFLITGTNYFHIERVRDRMDEIKFFREWKEFGWDHVKKAYPERVIKMESHPRGLREACNLMEINNVIPEMCQLSIVNNRVSCVKAKKARMDTGAVKVFRHPEPRRMYMVSVDVAEGIQTSEYTSDNSITQVFDILRKEQVAEWGGLFDEEVTAFYAVLIAQYFNNATIAPEMNNKCGGMLKVNIDKTGYKHIYYRQTVASHQLKREYGWHTSRGNKQDVCGQLRQDFKNGDCLLHSLDLLEEMLFFVDNKGKLSASSGHTDDRIMAASVNLKIIEDTPSFHNPQVNTRKIEQEWQPFPEFNEGSLGKVSRGMKREDILRRYR